MKILFFFIINTFFCFSSSDKYLDNEHFKTYNLTQMLEIEKNIKMGKQGNEVEEVRCIVTYLKNDLKWKQNEISRKFGVSEESVSRFFRQYKNPLCLIYGVYEFYRNNPNISLVSPPVVIETHWYNVFFKRPDSVSSSSSKESDRSSGYLKNDLDNDEEKEPLIEKDEKSKKDD